MNYLRYFAVLGGMLMITWQLYLFFSLDEQQVRAALGEPAPTKFIQVADDDLQALQKRLDDMKPFSESVLKKPSSREFGRTKGVFLPD
jgi:hypothetical protein